MQKIVVVDTETGGLDPAKHAILTLGAAVLELDPEGENYYKVSPSFHMIIAESDLTDAVTPEALKVNGLTLEQIAHEGMTPSYVVTAFEDWLHLQGINGRVPLAGHNIAGFDMGFIKRLYAKAGRKFPFDYHCMDTMSAAIILKLAGLLDVPSFKLDTLCKKFNIVIRTEGATHNSGEDAVATAKLLGELVAVVRGNVFEVEPHMFIDRSTKIDPKNLYARPGRFIPVDGPPPQLGKIENPPA